MPGRPRCRRGASRFWRGDSSASFITWVSGFLTIAHVVLKRLLVGHKLKPESRVPSEPYTKLIPSFFGIELRAILIVWAICHFRSQRISFVVVVYEDATRDFSQHQAGRQQVPSCAGHGNPEPGGQPLCHDSTFCINAPLFKVAKRSC